MIDAFWNELLGEVPPLSLPPLVALRDGRFGTESARDRRFPWIPEELDSGGDPYALVAYDGHGVNSFALYVVDVRPPHVRFFRMKLGGAYGDLDLERSQCLSLLRDYEAFRGEHEATFARSTIVSNMGSWQADLVHRDGRVIARRGAGLAGEESLFAQLRRALP